MFACGEREIDLHLMRVRGSNFGALSNSRLLGFLSVEASTSVLETWACAEKENVDVGAGP